MNKVKHLLCSVYLYFAHIDVHPLQKKIVSECEKTIDGVIVPFTGYHFSNQNKLDINLITHIVVMFLTSELELVDFDFVFQHLAPCFKGDKIDISILNSLVEDIDYIAEPKIYHKDMISIARYIRDKKKFDEIKYLIDACLEHGFGIEATHFSSGIHTYACPLLKDIGTIS